MRPGVHVDAGLGHRGSGGVPGSDFDDGRVAEERRELRGLGELRRELAEGQVLALLADQPERRDVPERGRAAVAEHDLVALGQREQLAPRRRGPCRPGSSPGPGGGRCRAGSRPSVASAATASGRTFDGPDAEASVGGLELSGNLDGVRLIGAGHQRVPFVVCIFRKPTTLSAHTIFAHPAHPTARGPAPGPAPPSARGGFTHRSGGSPTVLRGRNPPRGR